MSSTPDHSAVVTGAARGIGRQVASVLARRGIPVAIVDRDAEGAERTAADINNAGGWALPVPTDVADADQVAACVEQVTATLRPPGILVNGAGIIRDNLLFKMTDDDWDAVMHVHLRGAFLMTRACQSSMVDARWGRIVNISSTSALGNRGQANYSAAKAGLQGFTKTLAIELGPFGITANCIAPGFIATEMTEATAARLGVTFDEFCEQSAKAIPVQRVGAPDDIAHAVEFFISERAGFVSGQVLYVSGGPAA